MLAFISAVFLFLNPKKQFAFFGIVVLVAVYTVVIINAIDIVGNKRHHGIDSLKTLKERHANNSLSETTTDGVSDRFSTAAAPTSTESVIEASSNARPSPSR